MSALALWALGMPVRTANHFASAVGRASVTEIDKILSDEFSFGDFATKQQMKRTAIAIATQTWKQYLKNV